MLNIIHARFSGMVKVNNYRLNRFIYNFKFDFRTLIKLTLIEHKMYKKKFFLTRIEIFLVLK